MSNQPEQDKLANDLQATSIGDQSNQAPQSFNPNAAQAFVPQSYQGGYQGGYQQPGQAYQQPGPNQAYQGYQPQGQNQYQQYQGYQQNQNQQNQSYQGYQAQQGQGYQNLNTRGGYQNNARGGYQNTRGGFQSNRGGYNNSYNSYQPESTGSQGMSLADFEKQKAASQAALNKPKKVLKLSGSSNIKLATKTTEVKKDTPETKKEETPEKKESTPVSEVVVKKAEKAEKAAPAPVATPVAATPSSSSSTKPSTRENTPSVTSDAITREQEDEVDEEVVKDMFGGKDHVSIIFMGHVDAGKSTMGGNLLYLTGSVDKRTVDKYEREAKDAGRQGWYLSWVMDTNKEERNDGKTIEVGKAYFETEKRRYTILDAPGHKMYVSEMIGGASQADVGILVISARKGEYETGFEKGGQTREHALLAKTQGVNKIIVVVNKMDDTTVAWSEDRYKDCTAKLGQFLRGIGYAKDDILFMPVSGYTGAGLKARVDPKDCPWYTGPSLLEYLDDMKTLNRKVNAPFMLPVSGKMKDMGTIVEGKIESGHVKKGGNLIMMPNKAPVEVVGIYNETEQECDVAYCGEQVRLKIKGVEEEDIAPGYMLTSPKNPVKTVTRFEAQIAIVELKSILSNGFTCVMHLHAAIEEVKFIELKHKLEKGTNRRSKKPPAFAKKGMKVIAILEANEAVCAETYNDYQQLGRFTLRDQGTTIAIGKITKLL